MVPRDCNCKAEVILHILLSTCKVKKKKKNEEVFSILHDKAFHISHLLLNVKGITEHGTPEIAERLLYKSIALLSPAFKVQIPASKGHQTLRNGTLSSSRP